MQYPKIYEIKAPPSNVTMALWIKATPQQPLFVDPARVCALPGSGSLPGTHKANDTKTLVRSDEMLSFL